MARQFEPQGSNLRLPAFPRDGNLSNVAARKKIVEGTELIKSMTAFIANPILVTLARESSKEAVEHLRNVCGHATLGLLDIKADLPELWCSVRSTNDKSTATVVERLEATLEASFEAHRRTGAVDRTSARR
jgi:hypothetical protein